MGTINDELDRRAKLRNATTIAERVTAEVHATVNDRLREYADDKPAMHELGAVLAESLKRVPEPADLRKQMINRTLKKLRGEYKQQLDKTTVLPARRHALIRLAALDMIYGVGVTESGGRTTRKPIAQLDPVMQDEQKKVMLGEIPEENERDAMWNALMLVSGPKPVQGPDGRTVGGHALGVINRELADYMAGKGAQKGPPAPAQYTVVGAPDAFEEMVRPRDDEGDDEPERRGRPGGLFTKGRAALAAGALLPVGGALAAFGGRGSNEQPQPEAPAKPNHVVYLTPDDIKPRFGTNPAEPPANSRKETPAPADPAVPPTSPVIALAETPIAPMPREARKAAVPVPVEKSTALWNMDATELKAFGKEFILPQMKEAGGEYAKFIGEAKDWDKVEVFYPQTDDVLKDRLKRPGEKIEGKDNGGLMLLLKRGPNNLVTGVQPVILKTNAHFAYTTVNNNTYFSSDAGHLSIAVKTAGRPTIVNAVPSQHLHTLGFHTDVNRVMGGKQDDFRRIPGIMATDGDGNPVGDVVKSEIDIIGVPQAAPNAKTPFRWRHMDHNIGLHFRYQNLEMPANQDAVRNMVSAPMSGAYFGDPEKETNVRTVEGLTNTPGRNPYDYRMSGDVALTSSATCMKRLSAVEAARPGGDAFSADMQVLGQTIIGQHIAGNETKQTAAPVPFFIGAAVKTVEHAGSQNRGMVKDATPAVVTLRSRSEYPGMDPQIAEYTTGGINFGSVQADVISTGKAALASPETTASAAFLRGAHAQTARLNQWAVTFGPNGSMSGITDKAHQLAPRNNGMPVVRMLGAGGADQGTNLLIRAEKAEEAERKRLVAPEKTVDPLRNGKLPKLTPLAAAEERGDDARMLANLDAEAEQLGDRDSRLNVTRRNPIRDWVSGKRAEGRYVDEKEAQQARRSHVERSTGRNDGSFDRNV